VRDIEIKADAVFSIADKDFEGLQQIALPRRHQITDQPAVVAPRASALSLLCGYSQRQRTRSISDARRPTAR